MGFNPHAPDVLGLEWPPLYQRDVPLDAGIEYGQTFESTVAETLDLAYTYFAQSPSAAYRFHLLFNVYEKGQELATGPIQRTLVPVNGGTLDSATLVGGASIQACLATAADENYILLSDTGAFHVEFATAGLFTGKRILRLVLHHSIESPNPDAENPEIGALLAFDQPAQVVLGIYGYVQCDRTERTTDLGEMHPTPPTGSIATNTERGPWTVADVQALDTTAQRFWLLGSGDGSVRYVHYLALEVVWCEENRVAVGGRRYGTGDPVAPGRETVAAPGFQNVPLRAADGSAGWVKPATGEFTVTVGLGDTGGPYLDAPGSDIESFGQPPTVALLDSFTVFAPHEGRAIPRGVDNEPKSADAVSALPSIALAKASPFAPSPDPHPYVTQTAAPVYLGVTAAQEVLQQAESATTAYPWVRFWARRYGQQGAGLAVSCGGQSITVTAAELDALPEIIDGWRYVVLRFPTAPTFGLSGVQPVVFSAAVAIADRFEILGASYTGAATATGPGYGGTTAAATIDGTRDTTSDLAVAVATAAPTLAGLIATPRSFPVPGLGLDCGTTPGCIPTDIGYVDLIWTGVAATGSPETSVTGFGYYEVQRKDTDPDSTTYATIGKVDDPALPTYPDFEARQYVVSTYRARVVRVDGTEGDWSAPASATPPVPANSAPGFLIFTSNVTPGRSVAYGETFEGSASEDFGFPEADTRQLVRLYQQDYQRAMRPTERGGTAFTRALLISHRPHPDVAAAVDAAVYGSAVYGVDVYGSTALPGSALYGTSIYGTATYGNPVARTADSAFDWLRNLAWADLPYVCVLDDQGNRWFANVNVPSGNVRRGKGLFVAQVVITEVTATPSQSPAGL